MSRFVVRHDSSVGRMEWEVGTDSAEEALGHFISALRTVEHSDNAVDMHLTRFTLALMDRRHGMTVLDPDLKGSTTISITPTRTATN